jgi:hypothetical protein
VQNWAILEADILRQGAGADNVRGRLVAALEPIEFDESRKL